MSYHQSHFSLLASYLSLNCERNDRYSSITGWPILHHLVVVTHTLLPVNNWLEYHKSNQHILGGAEERKKPKFPAASSYATYLDFLACLKLVAPARLTRTLRFIVSRLTGWPSFLFCLGALRRLSHHTVLLHILKANTWTHHSIVSLN